MCLNAQDAMFAQMMIPHHQQAITMAKQAARKASSPEVKRLAAQIEQAQSPEIQKMTGWLQAWGAPKPSAGGMHMGDGMMSDQDMKKLDTLSGKAFVGSRHLLDARADRRATPLITAARVWYVARQDDRSRSDAIVVLGAAQFNGHPSPVLESRLVHALDSEGLFAPEHLRDLTPAVLFEMVDEVPTETGDAQTHVRARCRHGSWSIRC